MGSPVCSKKLKSDFVAKTIKTSAETWDNYTSKEIFNNNYILASNLNYSSYDGINSIMFGNMDNQNIIAETTYWFSKRTKQIYEADIMFNEYFNWGDATTDSSLMDLQNIATHELGHVVGLNDLYTSTCGDVTMFGYSRNGETKKRTLENPDIQGLQKIYGI